MNSTMGKPGNWGGVRHPRPSAGQLSQNLHVTWCPGYSGAVTAPVEKHCSGAQELGGGVRTSWWGVW